MTYLESYERCKTEEELKEEVKKDLFVARIINPDRQVEITKACDRVCSENGWKVFVLHKCPYGIKYETESKDFFEHCLKCPHCIPNEDSDCDSMMCELES